MFKKFTIIAIAILSIGTFNAQKSEAQKHVKQVQTTIQKPKLVVGLVIDQMRWDYLYRYQSKYTDGGFKRLLNTGYSFNNVMIPYIPTVTALVILVFIQVLFLQFTVLQEMIGRINQLEKMYIVLLMLQFNLLELQTKNRSTLTKKSLEFYHYRPIRYCYQFSFESGRCFTER
jgi:hypothetical protein